MDLGESAAGSRFLAGDRAGQLTASCDAVLADAGIQLVTIRPAARGRTLMRKDSCSPPGCEVTDRMLLFGERHLPAIPAEYQAHYNRRRPQRSRQLCPPWPGHLAAGLSRKRITRRPVLGGLLNEYERAV